MLDKSIKPIGHYSFENPPTIYDEDALTALELCARTAGKVNEAIELLNKCIDACNNMEANIPKYIEGDVDEWLDAHPEATTTVQDKSLEERKFTDATLLKIKNFHYSPEMFGAKGDGVTDDTQALKTMFATIEANIPMREFRGEAPCKDYTHAKIQFNGKYVITQELAFYSTYGLKLDGLNLIAGAPMPSLISFNDVTRNLAVSNCTFNGNLLADFVVTISGYSLTTDFVNVEITRFAHCGMNIYSKGHELKMTNCKINQVEWGETDILPTLSNGDGLYLSSDRHDNNFVNVVINYCKNSSIICQGTANTFVNCHFYGGPVRNEGNYNTYQNCYFDVVDFHTAGFFTLSNCFFNRSGDSALPFIYLTEPKENEWKYDQASITGCMFRAQAQVSVCIEASTIGYIPNMVTYGNTFYYVEPFVVHSKSTAPQPWQKPLRHTGDSTSGYVSIADVKFIWGTANADGFQYYPEGVTLTNTFYVGIQQSVSDGWETVYPNDIRADRFYLNNTGGKTYKWIAIGR